MAACIPDEVVDEVAVIGNNAFELSKQALARYKGLVDRVNIHAGAQSSLGRLSGLAAGFHAAVEAHEVGGSI